MFNPSHWRNIATAKTLFVMLFLAGIGLIISIVSLLYLSQHLISSKTNAIDAHRSALSVDGAIQTSVNRVLSLVVDNAIWDDAVHKVYSPALDTRWLYDTWGAGFKINNLYDGTFVLDEHYHVLWGSFHSQPFSERNLDFFGEGLTALIKNHAAELASGKNIFAGITETREGVAFVGIGLIRPVTSRLPIYDATRRYLVITRHLNAGILKDLGNTFQIDNLNMTKAENSVYSVPLKSSGNKVVGYLNWQPRLPGAEAAMAALPEIRQIVALAAGLILLFIVLSKSRSVQTGAWRETGAGNRAHRLAEPSAKPPGAD